MAPQKKAEKREPTTKDEGDPGPKVRLAEGFYIVMFRCPPDLHARLEATRGLVDRSTFLRDLLGKTLP